MPALAGVDSQFGCVPAVAARLDFGEHERVVARVDRQQVDLKASEPQVSREQAVAQPCEKGRGGGFVATRMSVGLKSRPVKAASACAMVTRRRRIVFFAGKRASRFCECTFGNSPRSSSARRLDSSA